MISLTDAKVKVFMFVFLLVSDITRYIRPELSVQGLGGCVCLCTVVFFLSLKHKQFFAFR